MKKVFEIICLSLILKLPIHLLIKNLNEMRSIQPGIENHLLVLRIMSDDTAYEAWLRDFLPQLFQPDFILEPGQVRIQSATHLT
jgi:hypothetical protein